MAHKNTSIATLVAIAVVAATTLVLSAFGISNYRAERNRLTAELRTNHGTWTEQLAVSLALPVWNFDREQINKIIDSSMHYQQITAIVVRLADANATLHARIRDARGEVHDISSEPASSGLWVQSRAITVNGDQLGTITVLVTPSLMQASLAATLRWTLFMIVLFDALLISGLYLLLWHLILKPLRVLERQAAIISSEGGSLNLPAGMGFRGELEKLRASLQNTMGLLQQRYEALRQSEERFELAVTGTSEGIWDWELSSDEVYYSPQFRTLLGYQSVAEFPPSVQSFWDHLHSGDRERVQTALQRHFNEQAPYDVEFRLCTRSGEYRWFRARAQAHWDAAGKAVRMAGSISDVHEQRKIQESLRLAQERELQVRDEFAQDLLTAQEQERKRIANELHDSVGQNLSLIASRIQLTLLVPDLPPTAIGHLEATGKIATDAITEIRALAHNLQPFHIEQLGLTDSLESLITQVQQSSHISIDSRLDNVDDVLTGSNATHVYRIVQEALNNILKHARAHQVRVQLERDVRHVRLLVADDGCGFDAQMRPMNSRGLGLVSMQERAHILGGHLLIDSHQGGGSTLHIMLPVTENNDSGVFASRLAEQHRP